MSNVSIKAKNVTGKNVQIGVDTKMEDKKTTDPIVEEVKKEIEFASFFTLQSLLRQFIHSREPSRGLRKKIDDWEKRVNEALSEVEEKHQRIAAFYALEELKEGQTAPKEALDKLNKAYMEKSKLSVEGCQFLTESDFDKCFPYEDNVLSRGDRKLLEYWVMIEDKEG